MLDCKILITLISGLILSPMAGAAQTPGPLLQPYQDHWFFSTEAAHAGQHRLFYQVCNRSSGNSAFRWDGAGFAVRAFSELKPDWCAFKNTYSAVKASPKPHQVKIQGKETGSVLTWSPDGEDGPFQSIYSYIETGTTGPEGFTAHSIISIEVQISADGGGTIVITSSGAFADVAIAFPAASIDPTSILDLADENVETSSTPLSEIGPAGEENAVVVIDNPDALAILIKPSETQNFTASFKSADLRQLGGRVHIFGRIANEIVILNEVPMPKPPS
jgi:hypothetical protein